MDIYPTQVEDHIYHLEEKMIPLCQQDHLQPQIDPAWVVLTVYSGQPLVSFLNCLG